MERITSFIVLMSYFSVKDEGERIITDGLYLSHSVAEGLRTHLMELRQKQKVAAEKTGVQPTFDPSQFKIIMIFVFVIKEFAVCLCRYITWDERGLPYHTTCCHTISSDAL